MLIKQVNGQKIFFKDFISFLSIKDHCILYNPTNKNKDCKKDQFYYSSPYNTRWAQESNASCQYDISTLVIYMQNLHIITYNLAYFYPLIISFFFFCSMVKVMGEISVYFTIYAVFLELSSSCRFTRKGGKREKEGCKNIK